MYDMPFAEYAAAPGLNGSKIVYMRRSPMHYRYMTTHAKPETDALLAGKLVHQMVLEPLLMQQVAIWGTQDAEKVRRGKVWEEFKSAHAGSIILTQAQAAAVTGMARAALSQAPIRKLASAEGPTEVSLFWVDEISGLQMKARLDKIIPEWSVIPDLKTTRDCSRRRFGAQAYDLGYTVKMAHYWDGWRHLTGKEFDLKLLALESTPPHESAVFDIPRDLILCGLDERNELVDKIKTCERAKEWPAAETDEVFLELPSWAAYQMADTELGLEA